MVRTISSMYVPKILSKLNMILQILLHFIITVFLVVDQGILEIIGIILIFTVVRLVYYVFRMKGVVTKVYNLFAFMIGIYTVFTDLSKFAVLDWS